MFSFWRKGLTERGWYQRDLVSVFGLESRQMFPAFFSSFPRVQYSDLKLNQDHNIRLYLISISGMSLRRDFYNFERLYRIIFCLRDKSGDQSAAVINQIATTGAGARLLFNLGVNPCR